MITISIFVLKPDWKTNFLVTKMYIERFSWAFILLLTIRKLRTFVKLYLYRFFACNVLALNGFEDTAKSQLT